jgi:hypothetical protein
VVASTVRADAGMVLGGALSTTGSPLVDDWRVIDSGEHEVWPMLGLNMGSDGSL